MSRAAKLPSSDKLQAAGDVMGCAASDLWNLVSVLNQAIGADSIELLPGAAALVTGIGRMLDEAAALAGSPGRVADDDAWLLSPVAARALARLREPKP